MIRKPIYEPKGKAKEYGDLALNIYNGCPHGCDYCYVPSVMRKSRSEFRSVTTRATIVESVAAVLERGKIKGNDGNEIILKDKLIHLCFACDPYPMNADTTVTREIIKLIKDSGNHVQILTKGLDGTRDFDLLDENDWYGITISGWSTEHEPSAALVKDRLRTLTTAKNRGIKTWVSFEPVIEQIGCLEILKGNFSAIDKVKVGKPNYINFPRNMEWGEFAERMANVCAEVGVECYLKESLREEREKR